MRLIGRMLIAPVLIPVASALTLVGWVMGDPNAKHFPRWTLQLIWYGYDEAIKLP